MNESIKSEASIQKYLFAGFVVSTTDQFHAHFHLNSNVSIGLFIGGNFSPSMG